MVDFGETSTIVVLPNCFNYSKNPALLVCVLEVILRRKTTYCVVLVQSPQRCYFPSHYSENLHCHSLTLPLGLLL